MSATDLGKQILNFNYNEALRAVEVNELLYALLEKGVYQGGALSNAGNNITIQPFDLLLPVDYSDTAVVPTVVRKIMLKARTQLAITLDATGWAIGVSHAFYASYTWSESPGNFLDFGHSPLGSVPANAVILGTANFDGLGNVVNVSTTSRHFALTQPDIRAALLALQSSVSNTGALTLTGPKTFDSDVSAAEVGRFGFFGGYIYFALQVGTLGSGRWGRVAIATLGF